MSSEEEIIKKIAEKKELSQIDSAIIEESLSAYLKKNKFRVENLSAAQLKIIVKDVRASLRESVGRFQVGVKNRQKLLERDEISKLLNTHSSTKERVSFYPQLRELIKRMNIKSILDLGCGINPIALAEPGVKYYASDINLGDLNLVKSFFQKKEIDGETFVCNLTKVADCKLPETDLTLVLKVFDILGKRDYEIAKRVLETVKSKHIIVSFSTRTLSGKPMNHPRRVWFEKLLNALCYQFETVLSDNEVFYVI